MDIQGGILIQPGDLLLVRSTGWGARWIRFGAAMRELVTGHDEPNLVNHVAIAHHYDPAGTLWVYEGRPGGVGQRDASDYLSNAFTVTNIAQPKTPEQRKTVVATSNALFGTPYDWEAIADDGLMSFGLHLPGWQPQFGKVPGHVVCSSLAAYAYAKAGLAHPSGDRNVSPADWDAFLIEHHWAS